MNQQKFLIFFLALLVPLSFQSKPFKENLSDPPLRQLQECQPGCLTCSSSEVCLNCDSHRTLVNGKCRCESPRILIANDCQCPWYMTENPTTQDCEYIDLIDVTFSPQISPLFDAIFQAQINPRLKWTIPPTFTWKVECSYQDTNTQDQLNTYLSTQQIDILQIPSSLLEHNLECNGKVSYTNQNSVKISKKFAFTTASYFQPQVQIVGGAFQMLRHTETNSILAEVVSLTGSPILTSDLKITWTQTSGTKLDMKKLFTSSNPLRLTLPKCTLSPGELYTFKINVQIGLNPLPTSQEVTIGVHASKINLKPIETDTYHIYTKDLTLTASQFSAQDECNQGILPADFIDVSSAKYIWECMIVDLDYTERRLLVSEQTDITGDTNVVTHPDPQHLFYRSTTSKTLMIPSSYFKKYKDYQLIFYLTATVQSKTPAPSVKNFNLLRPTLYAIQTKVYVQLLASKPFTLVSFSCENENNCQVFSDYRTKFIGENYNSKYTYTWVVNTFSGYEVTTIYNNWITFFAMNPDPNQKAVPQIILRVTDGKNTASSFFTLPNFTPIEEGSVYVYPSSGEAYNTNFFISTYLTKDDDLPMTFQFYSSCGGALPNFLFKKYEPYDYTPFLLPPDWGGCSGGVLVTDAFGYSIRMLTAAVTLSGRCASVSEALEKNYLAMDSTRYTSNLYQRMRLISVILENLQAWEISYFEETASYVTSSQFKYSTISELKEIFLALSTRDDMNNIMLQNILWASEHLFNEDKNWNLYMNIMDTYYQTDSTKSILTAEEADIFLRVLDNLIYYMKKPGNGIEDPEKVFTYANTLIRSGLSNLLPSDDDGFNFDGVFYSMFAMKTTYCNLLRQLIRVPYFFTMTANFTLKAGKTIPSDQCNNQIDFIFMALRKNYTVYGWGEFRTYIVLDIRDSITGKSLLDIFNFFLYSADGFCPDGSRNLCNPDDDGGTTIYGVFDLKDQIYKIFGKSKIDQIANISALSDFKFWQSVAFWTIIGFSIWFLISFYWLYIKHPTYCALTAKKSINKQPLLKKSNFFFWLVHPLVGIYLYNDPKITKATRLAMYYQRLVVVMLFSTLFSSISKGEGTIFRAYILLFNLCTVIPINTILSRTFGWAFQLKISKKKFVSYLKQSVVLFLYLAFLVACFFVIFIIEAQQDDSQNKAWAINFAISFLQDLTLAPLISITIKVLLVRFSQSKKTIKLKRTRTTITLLLENFKFIYNSIFQNTPIPNEIQSPTPTEIASPMSTSRKLLKLSTLDSPTLPRSPAKLVFKTRRVSDTEMGNVDSVAVETLVTDRFQTLFSEGKTERVKPLSPVKENFERMQSANIASTKFLTSSRLASVKNPRGLRVSSERKLVNMTSIVLSPLDPFSESVEIEPENEVFSPDESPLEGKANPKKEGGGLKKV